MQVRFWISVLVMAVAGWAGESPHTSPANVGRGARPQRDAGATSLVAEAAAWHESRPEDHRAALLNEGYEALVLRLHLIRHAVRSVEIQTFIWSNDEAGRMLIWELLQAARRGVKVRVIADHMFSDQDPAIGAFLATAHPNLEIRHYRPTASRLNPGLWRTVLKAVHSFRDVNQRMHSKVMVVDETVLITGGRNVENTYFNLSTGLNFHDRDVLLTGPAVRDAAMQFDEFWDYNQVIPTAQLKDVAEAVRKGGFRRFDRADDYAFGPFHPDLSARADDAEWARRFAAEQLRPVAKVRFLYDRPGKRNHDGATAPELGRAVRNARQDVLVQTPYLVLSRAAGDLFKELRERQPAVTVRVSTNSFASTDNLYAYSANYRLRNRYIEDVGLEIHEFKPRPEALLRLFPNQPQVAAQTRRSSGTDPAEEPWLCVHAKCLVVDNAVAFVGSYNLDPRSENLNTEVGLLIEDEAFARALRAEIEHDLHPRNSWVVARRPLPLRMDVVNGLVSGVVALSPIDVWPIQNTSSFELRPGREPVPVTHPRFHEHFRDVGPFPGAAPGLSQKEIMTRLYKAIGSPLTPIL